MSATDIIRAAEFTAERAWGARSIANLNGTTVRACIGRISLINGM